MNMPADMEPKLRSIRELQLIREGAEIFLEQPLPHNLAGRGTRKDLKKVLSKITSLISVR